MAKKKSPNKSKLIRDYLQEKPNDAPSVIANELNKRHRLKLTPGYVSTIKSKHKTGRKKSSKRGPAKKQVSTNSAPRKAAFAGELTTAFEFVRASGGLENAKKSLQQLETLFD